MDNESDTRLGRSDQAEVTQVGYTKERTRNGKAAAYEFQVFESSSLERESGIKWRKCTKNPGHKSFIPAANFSKEDLPVDYQTDDWLHYVRLASSLTVRLRVTGASPDRPDHGPLSVSPKGGTLTGTGFIVSKMDPNLVSVTYEEGGCEDKKWWRLGVTTASHVVYDDYEAKLTAVDFFYDDEESRADGRMKIAYGVDIFGSVVKYDSSLFYVVVYDSGLVQQINQIWHEMKLLEEKLMFNVSELSNLKDQFFNQPAAAAVIISHPHGQPKKVSVGEVKVQSLTGRELEFLGYTWAWVYCKYSINTCPGSSGANIFFLGGWKFRWSLDVWVGLHCQWDEFDDLNSGVLLCTKTKPACVEEDS